MMMVMLMWWNCNLAIINFIDFINGVAVAVEWCMVNMEKKLCLIFQYVL